MIFNMKTVDKKFQQAFKAYMLVLLMSMVSISQAQENEYDISSIIYLPDNYQPSSKDEIHLFLLTEKTFKRPYTGIKEIKRAVTGGDGEKVHFVIRGVEEGVYALRCYLDENNNGELDTFLMIPTEPWCLSWKEGQRKVPPRFKNISFEVKKDISKNLYLKD
ncbi:MAG: DUF2141 domain-containing protein [Bacteroidales bacterium]|nr:DUF2141 domain-containing protein [Bacteroidales bacterium]